MDDERFILEVESHSILFDTTHLFTRITLKKDRAWAEIAEKFGVKGKLNITLIVFL